MNDIQNVATVNREFNYWISKHINSASPKTEGSVEMKYDLVPKVNKWREEHWEEPFITKKVKNVIKGDLTTFKVWRIRQVSYGAGFLIEVSHRKKCPLITSVFLYTAELGRRNRGAHLDIRIQLPAIKAMKLQVLKMICSYGQRLSNSIHKLLGDNIKVFDHYGWQLNLSTITTRIEYSIKHEFNAPHIKNINRKIPPVFEILEYEKHDIRDVQVLDINHVCFIGTDEYVIQFSRAYKGTITIYVGKKDDKHTYAVGTFSFVNGIVINANVFQRLKSSTYTYGDKEPYNILKHDYYGDVQNFVGIVAKELTKVLSENWEAIRRAFRLGDESKEHFLRKFNKTKQTIECKLDWSSKA
jgi:hypothetical protein